MENLGYFFLVIVAIVWVGLLFAGIIMAMPYGIIGLFAIIGIGLLLSKVISDRLKNKEDDHYSNNVDQ
jgi:hypothetical protein